MGWNQTKKVKRLQKKRPYKTLDLFSKICQDCGATFVTWNEHVTVCRSCESERVSEILGGTRHGSR